MIITEGEDAVSELSVDDLCCLPYCEESAPRKGFAFAIPLIIDDINYINKQIKIKNKYEY